MCVKYINQVFFKIYIKNEVVQHFMSYNAPLITNENATLDFTLLVHCSSPSHYKLK